MSHDYHAGLPSFDENAIWQDGCGECEHRGEMSLSQQLAFMSIDTFHRAWTRALDWNQTRRVTPTAAEAALLRDLYAVHRKLLEAGDLTTRGVAAP